MSALRKDGIATIYKIQTRSEGYKNGDWFNASLDNFGTPTGFSAADECWQKTGHIGTFSKDEAVSGLKWIAEKNPGHEFRIAEQTIAQTTVEVATMKVAR